MPPKSKSKSTSPSSGTKEVIQMMMKVLHDEASTRPENTLALATISRSLALLDTGNNTEYKKYKEKYNPFTNLLQKVQELLRKYSANELREEGGYVFPYEMRLTSKKRPRRVNDLVPIYASEANSQKLVGVWGMDPMGFSIKIYDTREPVKDGRYYIATSMVQVLLDNETKSVISSIWSDQMGPTDFMVHIAVNIITDIRTLFTGTGLYTRYIFKFHTRDPREIAITDLTQGLRLTYPQLDGVEIQGERIVPRTKRILKWIVDDA